MSQRHRRHRAQTQRWEDLPPTALQVVCDHLLHEQHYHSAAAVCKAWRSSLLPACGCMTFNLHSGTVQSAVIWLQKHGQYPKELEFCDFGETVEVSRPKFIETVLTALHSDGRLLPRLEHLEVYLPSNPDGATDDNGVLRQVFNLNAPGLTSLRFTSWGDLNEGLPFIRQLPQLLRLETEEWFRSSATSLLTPTPQFLADSCPALQQLICKWSGVTPEFLQPLSRLTSLTSLDLQMLYDSLSWDCLAVLAAHLPQLQELELAGESPLIMQHFDGTWVAALASLTRLTSLTLGYVEVDFAAPCPGFKFASLKALRKLNLSHVTFRSGTVSEIVCTVMPSLTSLNCCGTDPIGSPKELLRLKDMPALEELDLRDCFTEVPLQVLLQLTRLSSLTLSCGKPYGFPADASAANQIPNAQSTGGAAADEGRCSLPPRCMSLEHLLAVGKVMTELDSDGVLWWRVPYMLSCMKRLQKLEIFELLDNNDNAGWQAALIVGGLASAGSRPPIRTLCLQSKRDSAEDCDVRCRRETSARNVLGSTLRGWGLAGNCVGSTAAVSNALPCLYRFQILESPKSSYTP